jgi:hypothetical protein
MGDHVRPSPRRARVRDATIAAVVAVGLWAAPAFAAAGDGRGGGGQPRLDDVALLGTHNSYHLRPARDVTPGEPADYAHAPLDVQLDQQGIRSIELDAYNAPDLPVFHSLIVDTESTCPTLAACLATVDAWSRANPDHEPLVVFFEPKVLPTNDNPAAQAAIDATAAEQGLAEWDAAGLERVDELLRDTFGERLITPDEVRGDAKTLRAAVRSGEGWPRLRDARGRVLVTLIGQPAVRDLYTADAPSLEGRAMFVDAEPRDAHAAVISADVPQPERVRRLTRRHFLVKTRADADGEQARANDQTRADAALASGAQIVVTDYPVPDPTIGPYFVELP